MKLNCKQGDLAIIVNSSCGNEGKIVRCLELFVSDRTADIHGNVVPYAGGTRPVWRIDRPITFKSTRGNHTTQKMYCSDARLRPLRGDLEDESIEEQNELSTVV
jgi:hypothetical protein